MGCAMGWAAKAGGGGVEVCAGGRAVGLGGN